MRATYVPREKPWPYVQDLMEAFFQACYFQGSLKIKIQIGNSEFHIIMFESFVNDNTCVNCYL